MERYVMRMCTSWLCPFNCSCAQQAVYIYKQQLWSNMKTIHDHTIVHSSRLCNIGYVFFILWFIKDINQSINQSIKKDPQTVLNYFPDASYKLDGKSSSSKTGSIYVQHIITFYARTWVFKTHLETLPIKSHSRIVHSKPNLETLNCHQTSFDIYKSFICLSLSASYLS